MFEVLFIGLLISCFQALLLKKKNVLGKFQRLLFYYLQNSVETFFAALVRKKDELGLCFKVFAFDQ